MRISLFTSGIVGNPETTVTILEEYKIAMRVARKVEAGIML